MVEKRRFDAWDAVVVLGLGSLGAGLWFYDFRISLAVVGSLLMAVGLMLSKGNQ